MKFTQLKFLGKLKDNILKMSENGYLCCYHLQCLCNLTGIVIIIINIMVLFEISLSYLETLQLNFMEMT